MIALSFAAHTVQSIRVRRIHIRIKTLYPCKLFDNLKEVFVLQQHLRGGALDHTGTYC